MKYLILLLALTGCRAKITTYPKKSFYGEHCIGLTTAVDRCTFGEHTCYLYRGEGISCLPAPGRTTSRTHPAPPQWIDSITDNSTGSIQVHTTARAPGTPE